MAALRVFGQLQQKIFLRTRQHVYSAIRYKSDDDYPVDIDEIHDADYPELRGIIPDPFPKTEEARRRSAEKYNLHPDEYKPFPPDYRYTGDYPDLPEIGAASRDPYYPWDFPHSRRNYGEPLPKTFNMMGEDRFCYAPREPVSNEKGAMIFMGMLLTFSVLYMLAPTLSHPLMEKQYPGSGEHYTFELKK